MAKTTLVDMESGFKQAIKEASELASGLEKVNQATEKGTKTTARKNKVLADSSKHWRSIIKAVTAINNTYGSLDTRIKSLSSSILRLQKSVNSNTTGMRGLNASVMATNAHMVRLKGGIEQTANSTKKATAATKGLLLSWQSLTRLLTIQILHQAVSLLSMALRQAANDAKELQLKLAEVRAISDGVFLSIGDWGSGLRVISEKWGSDILQLTEAAYQTVSNQIAQGSEAIKFVESASRLALAAVGTQTEAVNALSSVMNSYKLELAETDRVAAMLFETIKLGRTRLVNLGQDLGQVTPIAAQLGIEIEELLASIASLEILGMSSSEAVTQMRNVFLRLLRPTKEMQQVINDLGYPSAQAMFAAEGLADAFEAMMKAAKGNIDIITALNPRIRGMGATMEFTERRGLARLRRYTKAIGEAGDDYIKRAEEIMKTDAKKWERSTNAIKNYFLLDVGPALLKMLVAINGESNRLTTGIKMLTIAIGVGLVGAIGALIIKLKALALTPVGAVATLIGAASIAAIWAITEALKIQKEVIDSNRRDWMKWSNTLQVVNKELEEEISKTIKSIDDAIDKSFATITKSIEKDTEEILDTIDKLVSGYSNYFKYALRSVEDSIKDISKEIDNLQGKQEKIQGMIRGFQLDADKMMFQFILDDADIKQKFDLWTNRIKKLREEQAQASALGGASEVERIGKEINQALLSQRQIQQQAATQNQKTAKKRLEITQKIRDLEQQMFRTGDRDKRQAIDTDISGLRRELEGLKTLDIPDLDIPKKYREYTKNTIELLNDLKQKAHEEEQKHIKELAEYERKQNQITALMKRTEELSIVDMMKKEMPTDLHMRQLYLQDLKGMLGQYMSSIDQIRDISGKPIPSELSEMGKTMTDFIKTREDLHQTMLDQERAKKIATDYAIAQADAGIMQDKNTEALGRANMHLRVLGREAKDLAEKWKKFEDLPWRYEGGRFAKKENERRKEIEKNLKEQIEANNALIAEKTRERDALKDENLKRAGELRKLDALFKERWALGEKENKARSDSTDTYIEITARLKALLAQVPEASKIISRAEAIEAMKKVGDAAGGDAFGGPSYGSESRFMTPGEMIMSADSTRKFFNQYMTGNSSVASASGSSVNIGDINVTMQAHGNVNYDAQRLGNQIRREIRQGMLVL